MEPTVDLLRGLLAAAPDALLAVDPEGQIVFANDQVEQLFGWGQAEVLGVPVSRLVPEHAQVPRSSAQPNGGDVEVWARRRDGSEFPAEVTLSEFMTKEGKLLAAAIRDVSDSRRTEKRFRAVLASAPDAFFVLKSGRIELANEQAGRLYGYSVDELVGLPAEALVAGGEFDAELRERARVITDPTRRPIGAGLQLTARRQNGTTFPADLSLSLVRDDHEGDLVLCAVRDASERLEVEAARQRQALVEQRERSHRLESLGQLAGGIAHDFNNLLGVILNYTALLRREVTEPTAGGDLDEIRAAAERAASLTRQLLTFARRDVVDLEALEINALVLGLSDMLRRTVGPQIELRLDLWADPLTAVFDRHQLDQIILNLAINARDAMPDGGGLTISTSGAAGEGAAVVLRVADDGTGMPPEVVERVFEPFFSTKPKGEGTGLGLSTVYGIVQQHGGEVSIESEPERGTTVTVVLPGASGEGASSSPRAEQSAFGEGSERILLVEDEAALREGTARLLVARGYDVLTACDGIEALDIVDRQEPIDLVLTDLAMPRMRGDELVRRLAERHPRLPVIFMSGYDSGGAPHGRRLLAKPVAEHELLRAVREAFDR